MGNPLKILVGAFAMVAAMRLLGDTEKAPAVLAVCTGHDHLGDPVFGAQPFVSQGDDRVLFVHGGQQTDWSLTEPSKAEAEELVRLVKEKLVTESQNFDPFSLMLSGGDNEVTDAEGAFKAAIDNAPNTQHEEIDDSGDGDEVGIGELIGAGLGDEETEDVE